MAASVVCLSRAAGAAGEEIGRSVADALGFRYVDEEILVAAAEREGLEPEVLAAIERRRSGLSRLRFDLVGGGVLDDLLRSLIRGSIVETAAAGEVVIVAHAAAMALADEERALRVLVTATPETRARRLAEAEHLDEVEAARQVDLSDKARAAYFKRFYGVARELPTHYDLVLSTDRLSPADAAALICEAANTLASTPN
jgi:Cytidylate kinase-like family